MKVTNIFIAKNVLLVEFQTGFWFWRKNHKAYSIIKSNNQSYKDLRLHLISEIRYLKFSCKSKEIDNNLYAGTAMEKFRGQIKSFLMEEIYVNEIDNFLNNEFLEENLQS